MNVVVDVVVNRSRIGMICADAWFLMHAWSEISMRAPAQRSIPSGQSDGPAASKQRFQNGIAHHLIRRYLREIQLRWHPDKNAGQVAEATEVFREVQKYWELYCR
mmetsp:Transcript_43809/g.82149  ORF Transcript_43809/g.82149 Transcript_43809/m.82149 type:complete len:105 (+) Transcript_43809:563-877(+)